MLDFLHLTYNIVTTTDTDQQTSEGTSQQTNEGATCQQKNEGVADKRVGTF